MSTLDSDSAVSDTLLVGDLYEQHQPWLRQWLKRKVSCPETAADLVQDTFVRLLTRQQTYFHEPRAFLTTIARGLLIDFYRRRTLEQAWLDHLASLPDVEVPSPEQQHLLLEALLAVDRMLDGLPPKTRAAWLYSRLDGLTHAEIASHLKVSVPRVRQYLAKATLHCYQLRFGLGI